MAWRNYVTVTHCHRQIKTTGVSFAWPVQVVWTENCGWPTNDLHGTYETFDFFLIFSKLCQNVRVIRADFWNEVMFNWDYIVRMALDPPENEVFWRPITLPKAWNFCCFFYPSYHMTAVLITLHCLMIPRVDLFSPFPSNRHHRSNDDCLEGKRENYQVCSVQYCVQQLYSELHTHMNRPNSSLDWILSHWAHFTELRFIFVYVLFCVWLYIACMCSTVTWWGGPGGIEAWYFGPLLPSVLWHCWLGHLTRKTRPRYDL